MTNQIYAVLNKQWNSTCQILLGGEVGELSQFKGWLSAQNHPLAHAKSSLTGKDVTFFVIDYCEGAKRASFDELPKLNQPEKLSLNQLKDLDSIIDAVRESAYYTGNAILGNSDFIEGSSNCTDSHYILDSGMVFKCKYIADCSRIRISEYVFGSAEIGECKFSLRNFECLRNTRCLEAWKSNYCTDCYFSNGLVNCSDCMFCFNVKNRHYAIGNLELPKEKYLQIKQKLLSEMREKLSKEHSLPSLLDIVGKCSGDSCKSLQPILGKLEKPSKDDFSPIENAFEKTAEILFGRKLANLKSYSNWLKSHVLRMEVGKSIISGKEMLLADYASYLLYPRHRLVTLLEADYIGENLSLDESEIATLSFNSISKQISKIAYLSPECTVGNNTNVFECSTQYESTNAYRSPGTSYTKNTAYSFWPRSAECIFGSSMAFESFYCINCYNSENLNRCFEVDSSNNCADSYFCHNVENCNDCMFCFNVKNKKYAIGNVEFSREEYMKVKSKILSQIAGELEKTKNLKYDIYNIGGTK